MLKEVTSEELSEWAAYYSVKKDAIKNTEKADEAKDRAKRQGG